MNTYAITTLMPGSLCLGLLAAVAVALLFLGCGAIYCALRERFVMEPLGEATSGGGGGGGPLNTTVTALGDGGTGGCGGGGGRGGGKFADGIEIDVVWADTGLRFDKDGRDARDAKPKSSK